jgi:hypothetical protein
MPDADHVPSGIIVNHDEQDYVAGTSDPLRAGTTVPAEPAQPLQISLRVTFPVAERLGRAIILFQRRTSHVHRGRSRPAGSCSDSTPPAPARSWRLSGDFAGQGCSAVPTCPRDNMAARSHFSRQVRADVPEAGEGFDGAKAILLQLMLTPSTSASVGLTASRTAASTPSR